MTPHTTKGLVVKALEYADSFLDKADDEGIYWDKAITIATLEHQAVELLRNIGTDGVGYWDLKQLREKAIALLSEIEKVS